MSRSSRLMAMIVLVVAIAVPAVSALTSNDDGAAGATLRPAAPPPAAPADASTTTRPTSPPTPDSVAPTTATTAAAARTSTTVAAASAGVPTAASARSAPPASSTTAAKPAARKDPKCAATGNSALVDRKIQRAWLCTNGVRGAAFPVTTAWSMPDPGTYKVYAKDLKATSTFGGHFSRMTHFVAFSYGERTGARVAFHSLPTLTNGEFVQPLKSVGNPKLRGESNGCIRTLPDDAVRIWNHLSLGDPVIILT